MSGDWFGYFWHLWKGLFSGMPYDDQGLPIVALCVALLGLGVVLKRIFEN